MPKKPLSIVIISIIYFLSPAFILVQAALMANLPLFGRVSILMRLSVLDWTVLALYLACSVSVFSVKRWGWYVFMLASLALIADNVYVAVLRPGQYGLALVLAYDLLLSCAAGFFFRKKVIAPYFNPRIRWWETLPRYQALSYVLIGSGGSRFSANVIDVSESGCFAITDRKLAVGAAMPVELYCFGEGIALSAKVMRRADFHGSAGYGLMFVKGEAVAARALAGLTRRLSKAGLANRPWSENRAEPERRLALRFDTENEASIAIGGKAVWASIVDLSRTGCLLMANCDASLGERYPIRLRCMQEELEAQGVVRWKIPGGKANLIGIALELGGLGRARRMAALVRKLRKTGALERNRQNAPLDDQAILEYALKSPYRVFWKLSRAFRR
jgi:hypothetical protein